MSRKKAADLFDEPPQFFDQTQPDPPVTTGIDKLTTLDGQQLEIMTRTNLAIVRGIQSGTAFQSRYNSQYIQRKTEQLMRLAISSGAKGRQDIIEVIKAGGQMPDAFYQTNTPTDYAVDE